MKALEKQSENRPACELKGSALTLMVLHLLDADADRLGRQLQEKFGQAPGFFRNAPLVIDLGALPPGGPELDLAALVQRVREFGLVPVALRGGNEIQNALALRAGLGLLSASRQEPAAKAVAEPAAAEAEPEPEAPVAISMAPAPTAGDKVITHTIRSGQRVVAPDGDLIVLASVNSGAEILARGSIHVYGALRGRALAGVRGDAAARICCLQFHPELVAVAGEYMLHDELDPALLGKTAVVALANDRLQIEPLGTFVSGA
jgi:septum site-determining protein MinC